ncbi:hypothetical protein ACM66B_007116 [Microbotryomycetes sp. NB124-2]
MSSSTQPFSSAYSFKTASPSIDLDRVPRALRQRATYIDRLKNSLCLLSPLQGLREQKWREVLKEGYELAVGIVLDAPASIISSNEKQARKAYDKSVRVTRMSAVSPELAQEYSVLSHVWDLSEYPQVPPRDLKWIASNNTGGNRLAARGRAADTHAARKALKSSGSRLPVSRLHEQDVDAHSPIALDAVPLLQPGSEVVSLRLQIWSDIRAVMLALNPEENLDRPRWRKHLKQAYGLALQIPTASEARLAELKTEIDNLRESVAQSRRKERIDCEIAYKSRSLLKDTTDRDLSALAQIFPHQAHEDCLLEELVTPRDLQLAASYTNYMHSKVKDAQKSLKDIKRESKPMQLESALPTNGFPVRRQMVADPQAATFSKEDLPPWPDNNDILSKRLTGLLEVEFRALCVPGFEIDEHFTLNHRIRQAWKDCLELARADHQTFAEEKRELRSLEDHARMSILHPALAAITTFEKSVRESSGTTSPAFQTVLSGLVRLLCLPDHLRNRMSTYGLKCYGRGLSQKIKHAVHILHTHRVALHVDEAKLKEIDEILAPLNQNAASAVQAATLARSKLVAIQGHPQDAFVSARTARRYGF